MLYPISVEGKRGFIDGSGNVVIEPQFLSVGEFSEGLARVTVPGLTEEDRKFERNAGGFIDEHGKFVIGPGSPPGFEFTDTSYYSYGDFHDNRATFWVGDATGCGGFIDRTGKVVIPTKFADVNDFSEGLACVSVPRDDGETFDSHLARFIDCNGEFVIPPDREFSAIGFSEGRCVISVEDDEGDWQDSVIDARGETIIPPGKFESISDFVGGLSRVVRDDKVGCINTMGDIVVPIEFDKLWEFEHSPVTTGVKNGKWFIVDRTGRCVKELRLGGQVELGRVKGGLATVTSNNKVGFINTYGDLVIPMRFDQVANFDNELARAKLGNDEGYINKQGEFVWKTDRWDEPLRYSVSQPLSQFLPPTTTDALPLDYHWQRVKNAIVFSSSEPLKSLKSWFTKTFSRRFELSNWDSPPGQVDIDFFGDEMTGSLHAIDVSCEDAKGFVSFYPSKNLKRLFETTQSGVVGVLVLDR